MQIESIDCISSNTGTVKASEELIKLTLTGGFSFYTRRNYISLSDNFLNLGIDLSEQVYNELITAGQTYLAERYALECLGRREYCRLQLVQKLQKKGFALLEVNNALDFLEKLSYLSDRRFAGAWVESRAKKYSEGKLKLFAGLIQHGVDRHIADEAISNFFLETTEQQLLEVALKKISKTKKNNLAIVQSLVRKGFPLGLISRYMEVPFS